jgi:hypothetical protein
MADRVLPSWNERSAFGAIVDFVVQVTRENSPHFVRPAERIATFDNHGKLWCEQPLQNQFFFAMARLEALAAKDPGLRARQPFKAFLERDTAAIHALGKQAALEIAFATHAGMTVNEFAAIARDWFATARHPKLNRPFAHRLYQPQVELLAYLRANGFKILINSGGGIDLIRAFAEANYGIPPEQVVGSSVMLRFDAGGGHLDLLLLSELNSFDDHEVKPANIALHIGQRPILAFGNSDADVAMLLYGMSGPGPRLAMMRYDDAEREYAYNREFRLSPLVEGVDKAGEYGFILVSMRQSWRTVFPETVPHVHVRAGGARR